MSKKYLFTCLSIGLVIVIFSIFQISGASFDQSLGFGHCGGLNQEAEAGQLMGQMQIGMDGNASGGKFVHAPDEVEDVFTITNNPDQAIYCVNVPETGVYQIKTWVNARNLAHNSFFLTINNTPSAGYLFDLAIADGFQTDMVNDRTMGDPLSFKLEAGEHTLTFYNRESGTRFDRFELIPVSIDVSNPPKEQCAPSEQEAAAAEQFGKMNVAQFDQPNGGAYVPAPLDSKSNYELNLADRADFCVTIPEDGTHKVIGRVWGQNYLNVDGAPAAVWVNN